MVKLDLGRLSYAYEITLITNRLMIQDLVQALADLSDLACQGQLFLIIHADKEKKVTLTFLPGVVFINILLV